MLEIGGFRAGTCGGWTRRAFLRAGGMIPLALASREAPSLAATGSGRARSTVFVWLWGAPSHIDTFDPKPLAPADYRGPFAAISTRVPGVTFTELLPRLAARADHFSLVRSHLTHDGAHPPAGTLGMTGYKEGPGPLQPSFGSIVSRHRAASTLPPYILVGRGVPRDIQRPVAGFGGGEWGAAYDPFIMHCDDLGQVDIPSLKILDGLTPQRLLNRRLLASQLDQLKSRVADRQFDSWDRSQQQAFTLLTSQRGVAALDLSRESETARAAYGQTSFGQSLLLARRLVEAEVPFVHVNWSQYVEALTPNTDFGWDTHIHNFDLLPSRHCPIFDRAFSAFLDDLEQRGLLESTLVVALGEFGRTPKINKRAARDHWPQCYFSLWAGGGVRGGRVIGASDRRGEHPVTRPIEPPAIGTTIMDLMGIDSVARAKLNVLRGGEVIRDLL